LKLPAERRRVKDNSRVRRIRKQGSMSDSSDLAAREEEPLPPGKSNIKNFLKCLILTFYKNTFPFTNSFILVISLPKYSKRLEG
jgi:hypothetical protein